MWIAMKAAMKGVFMPTHNTVLEKLRVQMTEPTCTYWMTSQSRRTSLERSSELGKEATLGVRV